MIPQQRCEDSPGLLAQWRTGHLDTHRVEPLLIHLLRCPRCLRTCWLPFAASTTVDAEQMLDALLTPDAPRSTQTGGSPLPPPAPTGSTLAPMASDGEPTPWPRWEPGGGARLRTLGSVLPLIPQRPYLTGYTLYLGGAGPRPSRGPGDHAAVHVRADGGREEVFLEALLPDVYLDGQPLPLGQAPALHQIHLLQRGLHTHLLDLGEGAHALGALGVIHHPGPAHPITSTPTTLGRDPRSSIVLPDREEAGHLQWDEHALQALSPAERQELRGITLDTVDVHRRHAQIVWEDGALLLRGAGTHHVLRVRGAEVRSTRRDQPPLPLLAGDTLKVGNALFEVLLD